MLEQEGCNLIVAAFEVPNEKGFGFLENIDQECPEMEVGRSRDSVCSAVGNSKEPERCSVNPFHRTVELNTLVKISG